MPNDTEDIVLNINHTRMAAALAEYKEVVAQFRNLTDIRFKLLTYLPLGTVAAVVVSKESQMTTQPAVALFGFVATLCIATYNKRNDQHYDELVARAAELEQQELGLTHGSFSQRPTSWLKYGPVPVEHRWPIGGIYAAATALWAYLFFKALVEENVPLPFAHLTMIIAPALVILGWLALRYIESFRRKRLRRAVLAVMDTLVATRPDTESPKRIVELAELISAKECLLGVDKKKAIRRLSYHWSAYTVTQDVASSSLLLSEVVDLPARWIRDIWTGRR
jgi:hypothetical protein